MEQLKNERLRLREQNNFLDLLIKASPMGVIITSLDEDLSELNPMALKMLGVRLEDVQGKKMKEIDSVSGGIGQPPERREGNRPSERLEYLPVYSFFFH